VAVVEEEPEAPILRSLPANEVNQNLARGRAMNLSKVMAENKRKVKAKLVNSKNRQAIQKQLKPNQCQS